MLTSQPSWCGLSWRHTVERDTDIPDPPKASQLHTPPIQKECGPQERESRPPTPSSPGRGSPVQATLWSGNAVVKMECDSVATLASHRTMLGQHKCQLSPCDPTSWGPTSPHEGPLPPKQVHLSFVSPTAGLRITSPCTPQFPAHLETLPQAKGIPGTATGHHKFPSHSQSPSPTHQSLQPSQSNQALPSPLLATVRGKA